MDAPPNVTSKTSHEIHSQGSNLPLSMEEKMKQTHRRTQELFKKRVASVVPAYLPRGVTTKDKAEERIVLEGHCQYSKPLQKAPKKFSELSQHDLDSYKAARKEKDLYDLMLFGMMEDGLEETVQLSWWKSEIESLQNPIYSSTDESDYSFRAFLKFAAEQDSSIVDKNKQVDQWMHEWRNLQKTTILDDPRARENLNGLHLENEAAQAVFANSSKWHKIKGFLTKNDSYRNLIHVNDQTWEKFCEVNAGLQAVRDTFAQVFLSICRDGMKTNPPELFFWNKCLYAKYKPRLDAFTQKFLNAVAGVNLPKDKVYNVNTDNVGDFNNLPFITLINQLRDATKAIKTDNKASFPELTSEVGKKTLQEIGTQHADVIRQLSLISPDTLRELHHEITKISADWNQESSDGKAQDVSQTNDSKNVEICRAMGLNVSPQDECLRNIDSQQLKSLLANFGSSNMQLLNAILPINGEGFKSIQTEACIRLGDITLTGIKKINYWFDNICQIPFYTYMNEIQKLLVIMSGEAIERTKQTGYELLALKAGDIPMPAKDHTYAVMNANLRNFCHDKPQLKKSFDKYLEHIQNKNITHLKKTLLKQYELHSLIRFNTLTEIHRRYVEYVNDIVHLIPADFSRKEAIRIKFLKYVHTVLDKSLKEETASPTTQAANPKNAPKPASAKNSGSDKKHNQPNSSSSQIQQPSRQLDVPKSANAKNELEKSSIRAEVAKTALELYSYRAIQAACPTTNRGVPCTDHLKVTQGILRFYRMESTNGKDLTSPKENFGHMEAAHHILYPHAFNHGIEKFNIQDSVDLDGLSLEALKLFRGDQRLTFHKEFLDEKKWFNIEKFKSSFEDYLGKLSVEITKLDVNDPDYEQMLLSYLITSFAFVNMAAMYESSQTLHIVSFANQIIDKLSEVCTKESNYKTRIVESIKKMIEFLQPLTPSSRPASPETPKTAMDSPLTLSTSSLLRSGSTPPQSPESKSPESASSRSPELPECNQLERYYGWFFEQTLDSVQVFKRNILEAKKQPTLLADPTFKEKFERIQAFNEHFSDMITKLKNDNPQQFLVNSLYALHIIAQKFPNNQSQVKHWLNHLIFEYSLVANDIQYPDPRRVKQKSEKLLKLIFDKDFSIKIRMLFKVLPQTEDVKNIVTASLIHIKNYLSPSESTNKTQKLAKDVTARNKGAQMMEMLKIVLAQRVLATAILARPTVLRRVIAKR